MASSGCKQEGVQCQDLFHIQIFQEDIEPYRVILLDFFQTLCSRAYSGPRLALLSNVCEYACPPIVSAGMPQAPHGSRSRAGTCGQQRPHPISMRSIYRRRHELRLVTFSSFPNREPFFEQNARRNVSTEKQTCCSISEALMACPRRARSLRSPAQR
jgi:hypothetical protein